VQARDDGPAGVDHERAVAGAERRVAPLVEIARPGGEVTVGLVAVLRAQDVAGEVGHRLGVRAGARTEHEALSEVTDHGVPPGWWR
jgi:hypothetical protein